MTMIADKLAVLDGSIACIATCNVARKIAVWSSKQQCSVLAHSQNEWISDDIIAEKISSQLRKYIEADAEIELGAKWCDDRICMVIDTKFSLVNNSHTLIAIDVNLNNSSSRVVYSGDFCPAYIPEPIRIDENRLLIGLRNGVLKYAPGNGETTWIGRVDSEPLDDLYFAPDGIHYKANENILRTMTYDMQGPAYIISYYLDSTFDVTNQDAVVVDSEREEDRNPYERSNFVATCLNQFTGQIAYLMAPDEWPVKSLPKKGSPIPIANLYIGNPIRSATKIAVYGKLGVNVNCRRVDPETPNEKPAFWVFRINTMPVRMFLVPLGPDQYLLGLTGGTLCVLNTKTGTQTDVMQMPAEISALKPGFEPSEFFVGLVSGELHLVNISFDS